MATKDRLEVIGKQKSLFGADIDITQFKNLKEKRELKEKVKRMFKGVMFRSIITPRNIDGNLRSNKLERLKKDTSKDGQDLKYYDSFGKKTLNTLSTFPSTLTLAYTTLLSKEGDKVYDPFMGHNSRAEDVLANGRKYYGYDVHKFPVDFTQKAIVRFPKENYELNLASSEKSQYSNESMDFAFTCYDKKTEVLTKRGFIFFKDLTKEDLVATINKKGFLEYQNPIKLIKKDYKGKMFQIRGEAINLLITPNHNLYAKKYTKDSFKLIQVKTAFKNVKSQWKFKKDAKWNGKEEKFFILPKYFKKFTNKTKKNRTSYKKPLKLDMDSWLEFFGYWISEGSLDNPNIVELWQNADSPVFQKMIKITKKLGFSFSTPIRQRKGHNHPEGEVRIQSIQLRNYLKQFGKSYQKYIPQQFLNLSSRQLQILINALMEGDGYIQNKKHTGYKTSSKKLINNFYELLLKTGKSGTLSTTPPEKAKIRGKIYNIKECYSLSINHQKLTPNINCDKNAKKKQVEIKPYNNKVYCCTVPNSIIHVRRNGKTCWCGNCPPYADVEQYNKIYNEKVEGDLSSKKYEEFLVLYQKCISETYRVLKPGKYFVIIVGDIHRQGKFIQLSSDTDTICEQVGFIKHDENIYNRKSNIGGDLNYKTFILTCKRFPTIHEYILVYQKPELGSKITKTKIPKFIPSNPIEETSKEAEINTEEQLKQMGEIERARYLKKLKEGEKNKTPLTDEMEGITLNKDIFDQTMKLFNIKLKNCKYCNSPITKDNFGIIALDTFVCNDITCIFEAFEDLDKKEEVKKQTNKNDN